MHVPAHAVARRIRIYNPAMRRDSSYKWLQALLGVASIALVAWFLSILYRASVPEEEARAVTPEGIVPPAATPAGATHPPGNDRILRCTAPDGSTFYTNAARCEDVDLDDRLTVIDAWPPDTTGGEPAKRCLSDGDIDASLLRFLPRCHQIYTEALKVEKFLSQATDPAASPRAAEYCDWISRGVQTGCMANSQLFCHLEVCQRLIERSQPGG